ncbi:kelch-like protein 8 [Diplodia corticola]|uniref:Kelch-like protein 8 n=1 Tax=Diplodia corticola TaxID=236234 RepID=A0A1J9RQ40_9PEZI|nr:kelch-like protein 8 [Diplodia corticola]OJD30028.1 kelch-like protein 8 [Diplodia corticola]
MNRTLSSTSLARDRYSGSNIYAFFDSRCSLKEVIQVVVSHEKKPFSVHKELIFAYSDFFKYACREPWKESGGVVELHDTESGLFDIYLRWLYWPNSLDRIENPGCTTTLDGARRVDVYKPLFDLYALGHMLQDYHFRNNVLNKIVMVARTTGQYPNRFAAFVHDMLPPASPLWRLYVDFWTGQSDARWLKTTNPADDCNSLATPMEFFRDILRRQKLGGSEKHPWEEDICQYHDHPRGTLRCADIGKRAAMDVEVEGDEHYSADTETTIGAPRDLTSGLDDVE